MKILAVFAHPDDESYGPAGTLAKASRNGNIVSLLTLTRGESGTVGISKNFSDDELAQIRHREVLQAAKILGIQRVQIHNLSDNKLQDTPNEEGVDIIKKEINRFKPDSVITYHENGISGHPDHLAVTNWTVEAAKSIPQSPSIFLYGFDRLQTSMITFQKLFPIANHEITHRINVANYIDQKIAAIRCHKTQESVWHQFEKQKIDFKKFAEWDVFVQKWPETENLRIKYDLFE